MRQIYQFSGPIRGVQARHGFILYNQHCHYIGRSIELYGEYCEHEINLFASLLRPTDVVWEIGANTGSQSPALSKIVSEGRFVGFEPQIELFKIFASNLTLNNCENALPLCLALGNQDGTIALPPVNYHQPNNFGAVTLLGEQSGARDKVEIRRIDSLDWLPSPNFMKIDVEGMETNVLNGAVATIKKNRPTIYVENDRVENSEGLIRLLWGLEYRLYWHITPYFNQNNFFDNGANIYGNTASFNMLCIPAESELQVGGQEIVDATIHPLKA
jgi:FkbM family methyltransferase